MTPEKLLIPEVQAFIKDNERNSLHKLILKGSPFKDQNITIQEIAQQIDGRSRVKKKLPLWYRTNGILYPPKLNLEQTSSETTALYKSKLMQSESLLDLTGGFGVDSYYFAQHCSHVTHIEINRELSELAGHNFNKLGVSNIRTVVGDGIEHLSTTSISYDTIFIDPARRAENKARVFLLEDCTPNISQYLELLLNACTDLWIKTAPMLDIALGLKTLKHVIAIHIIAVKNEVKEILWHLSRSTISDQTTVTSVNLNTTQKNQTFTFEDSFKADATYSLPQGYLYEPNAALLKSGAFKWISSHFSIPKLHQHTHLYTSKTSINFPGRSFKIIEIHPYSKKLKKQLNFKKAHITTRNFRVSVDELRKKLRIEDGGDLYLFFTTQLDGNSIVIVCSKISA